MPWLEQRGDQFHLTFQFGGRKFKKSLKTSKRQEAEDIAARVQRRIRMIEAGDLTLPEGADVLTFFISDGKRSQPVAIPRSVTLHSAQIEFLASLPTGAIEANTVYTIRIHFAHLVRLLGKSIPLEKLTFAVLQKYADSRSKEAGRRGRPVSATTIRKELGSLSSLWSWAIRMGYVRGAFPGRGLRLPKVAQKPPFQTFYEVERRASRAGLSEAEKADLWSTVYLTRDELAELLAHLKTTTWAETFLYPMVFAAVHTGARRSELLRSERTDIDPGSGTILIREKKKAKGKQTFRSVPISSKLAEVFKDWLAQSDSQYTFHQDGRPLTPNEATHNLRNALAGTKWKHLPGWHVFRHSFVSNCASMGVDQRMIDNWVGHTTAEMAHRYRHLIPDVQQTALKSVFG